jgi:hypothetical protein
MILRKTGTPWKLKRKGSNRNNGVNQTSIKHGNNNG